MAATVKTLLEHHGELYWGTRKANPGYCYGLALDVGADGLAAELVYVIWLELVGVMEITKVLV